MKKLAIFDFDGTIFNSVDDVVICLNEALTIHGFPALTRKEIVGSLGGNIDNILSLVLRDKNTPENIEMVKKTYLGIYYPAKKENSVPFPKSIEILKELQSMGVILAINSNRFTDSIESFVDIFFSDINFILIKGHDFDCPTKPDHCGVNQIIKKAGVGLKDTLYIGDSNTDIMTAENAGIDCVVVKWGYGSEKEWENEDILECIDDFSQILKYFKCWDYILTYKTMEVINMLFVQYPKCSTCRKAKNWLDEHNIEYESRHIVEDNPKEDEIENWYAKSGLPLKRFFNTSGKIYRENKLKDKIPDMFEKDQFDLLATDGMLVKRPIVVGDDFVLVGFKVKEWEEKLL